MKLSKIKGDLVTVDIEVESFNRQYGTDYDRFILTPQTSKNTKQHLYGFYGLPLDNTEAYIVKTFYR